MSLSSSLILRLFVLDIKHLIFQFRWYRYHKANITITKLEIMYRYLIYLKLQNSIKLIANDPYESVYIKSMMNSTEHNDTHKLRTLALLLSQRTV